MSGFSNIPAGFAPAEGFLDGRTLLITGATGGLGQALVEACAAHGAVVVMAGRRVSALERLSDRVVAAGHPQPVIYPVELSGAGAGDYEQMARAIGDQFGALDAVLHLAAAFAGLTPLAQTDPEVWQATLAVNLTAPFLINRAVLGLLQRSDRARIVFTLDDEERSGAAYWGAYGVTKRGLRALTAIAADELEAYRIEVNAVVPPPLATRLRRQAYLDERGAPAFAPAVAVPTYLYLLAEHPSPVTGRVFAVASDDPRAA